MIIVLRLTRRMFRSIIEIRKLKSKQYFASNVQQYSSKIQTESESKYSSLKFEVDTIRKKKKLSKKNGNQNCSSLRKFRSISRITIRIRKFDLFTLLKIKFDVSPRN